MLKGKINRSLEEEMLMIQLLPFTPPYYVRSGSIYANSGRFGYVGINGMQWSSRAQATETTAYYMDAYANGVSPSSSNDRRRYNAFRAAVSSRTPNCPEYSGSCGKTSLLRG